MVDWIRCEEIWDWYDFPISFKGRGADGFPYLCFYWKDFGEDLAYLCRQLDDEEFDPEEIDVEVDYNVQPGIDYKCITTNNIIDDDKWVAIPLKSLYVNMS